MNKLLVLSGGTKGIGKSIIHQFAANNFDIITCSRNHEELQQLRSDLESQFPGISAFVYQADLATMEGTQEFVNFVSSMDRDVDVLVNNAGVFYPGQIHNEENGILEKSMQINVYSAYHLTRGVLKGMLSTNSGHIFNICSVASIEPYVRGASYSMSKFALLGFSKVLREEMKDKGIRVTSVIPGSTLTPTWDGVDLPEEDFMKPEDIANAVYGAYTLSEQTVIEEIVMRPQKGDV